MEGLTVGAHVQYYSSHHHRWVSTTIVDIDRDTNRYKVKDKSTWQMDLSKVKLIQKRSDPAGPSATPVGTPQLPTPVGTPAALAPASAEVVGGDGDGEGGNVPDRSRGEVDDTMSKLVQQWLTSFNNVEGIMKKFKETYQSTEDIKALKQKMLEKFSKEPRQGVCWCMVTPNCNRHAEAVFC